MHDRIKLLIFVFFLSMIFMGEFWIVIIRPKIEYFVQRGYEKGLEVCKDKLIGYNVLYNFNLSYNITQINSTLQESSAGK